MHVRACVSVCLSVSLRLRVAGCVGAYIHMYIVFMYAYLRVVCACTYIDVYICKAKQPF